MAPDAERLRDFAERINRAQRPLVVFGPEVDRSGGWDAGVAFAEKVGAPVRSGPLPDRASFPENHPLYGGMLPLTIAGVAEVLRGHDLVVVIGAQVFRYYPYVAGEYLPEGSQLLQITADPALAGAAPVGDSLISDTRLALEQLVGLINDRGTGSAPAASATKIEIVDAESSPLTPDAVWSTLATVKPADSPVITESTSTMAQQLHWLPTTRPGSFFATASGGIGWGVPGAVGVALGDRARGVKRSVIATIGDGSFQYSIQAIYTAAQHRLPIVFVVMRNEEYSVLKAFALLEETPNVPGLDLPGLDIASLATGYGCRAVNVDTTEKLAAEFTSALSADGPTVIVVRTKPQLAHLGYGLTHARGRPRVTRELRASTFIGMSADNPTEQMSLIGAELTRRTEQLGAAVASTVRAEIDFYEYAEVVSNDELIESCTANVRFIFSGLTGPRVIRYDTSHRYRRIPCAEPGSVAAGDGGLPNRLAPHLAGASGDRGGPRRHLAACVARGDRADLGGAGCLHQRHDGRLSPASDSTSRRRRGRTRGAHRGPVFRHRNGRSQSVGDRRPVGDSLPGPLRRRRRAHPGTGQARAAGDRRQAAQPRHLFRLAAATRAADRHRAPAL